MHERVFIFAYNCDIHICLGLFGIQSPLTGGRGFKHRYLNYFTQTASHVRDAYNKRSDITRTVVAQVRRQQRPIVRVQLPSVELQTPGVVGHVEGDDEGVGQASDHLHSHPGHSLVVLKTNHLHHHSAKYLAKGPGLVLFVTKYYLLTIGYRRQQCQLPACPTTKTF